MDELLDSRVKQLREIDDRLERILKTPNGLWDWESTKQAIVSLRRDVSLMISRAEEEYRAF